MLHLHKNQYQSHLSLFFSWAGRVRRVQRVMITDARKRAIFRVLILDCRSGLGGAVVSLNRLKSTGGLFVYCADVKRRVSLRGTFKCSVCKCLLFPTEHFSAVLGVLFTGGFNWSRQYRPRPLVRFRTLYPSLFLFNNVSLNLTLTFTLIFCLHFCRTVAVMCKDLHTDRKC